MLLHLLLKHENCRSSEIAKYKCDLQYFYNLVQHTTHQNLINGWKINKSVPKNIITTCAYIYRYKKNQQYSYRSVSKDNSQYVVKT